MLACLLIRANRRPAVATYLRRWDDVVYRPFVLTVLRVEGGMLAEVTTFAAGDFDRFALPQALVRS